MPSPFRITDSRAALLGSFNSSPVAGHASICAWGRRAAVDPTAPLRPKGTRPSTLPRTLADAWPPRPQRPPSPWPTPATRSSHKVVLSRSPAHEQVGGAAC
jgi:hypothetical protein